MAKPVSRTRQRQSRAQLSLKQQRFVKEYAHLGNASEAARKAGYKPRQHQEMTREPTKPRCAAMDGNRSGLKLK